MSAHRDLSGWWTGGTSRHLRGKDEISRLAIAMGPIRSIVRVVDDRRPPMTVDWAQVGSDDHGNPLSMSYTDFRGARIAVNPLPILEDRLDPADQIDVCVGQALHEASHSRHSKDVWLRTLVRQDADGRDMPAFEPLRVAAWLFNVAEDPRVEGLTAADWPGFAPYFDRLLDWLWDEGSRKGSQVPTEVGHTVADRLRVAFLGARFPDRSSTAPREVWAEAQWWDAWRQDYAAGRATAAETVRRGLDRLGDDPAVEREMAEMTLRDAEERKAGEALRHLLERIMEEGVDGAPQACAAHGVDYSELDIEDAAAVRKLVSEGLATVDPIIPHRGSDQPVIRVHKPMETAESRRAYVGRPDPLTEAMRAALVFRQSRPRHDLKLQRSGEVDDEELWRFGAGDLRVFTERVVEARPDTALGLLVDVSGSMLNHVGGRTKIATAQRLAQILLVAASDTEGVTPYVWAHTGDANDDGSDVYTVWEPGDPVSRLGIIGAVENGNNYDGFAIALCADRLRQMEQEQKVLLVLSDGLPAGAHYGGREAQEHVRSVCRWAESVGVTVIQIAIDGGLRPADQAAMFGTSWIPYTSDRQLPRDMTAILGRYAR